MIVVDSSVWIARINLSDTEPVRKLRTVENTDEVLVGDLILLEVLQGARNERDASRMEHYLRSFAIASMLDDRLASKAARNYRHLRSLGVTVRKTTDMIIGTFCIEREHTLLQNDRDFQPMATHLGLRLI